MFTAEDHLYLVTSLIQNTQNGTIRWIPPDEEDYCPELPNPPRIYSCSWNGYSTIELIRESDEILTCRVYEKASTAIHLIGFDCNYTAFSDGNRYHRAIMDRLIDLWDLLSAHTQPPLEVT